jgi:hypothetical protein
MMLTELVIDRGLIILLDSELADVSKTNLQKATTRLNKKQSK